jgi:hypothetical protein
MYEKHNNKNSQLNSHPQPSKNIPQTNKYHKRKNKKTNKSEQIWKKQNSFLFRGEKENDKNNLNYNYSKKYYFDNNKKKNHKYHKKNKNTEFEFDLDLLEKENINIFNTQQNIPNFDFFTNKKPKISDEEQSNSNEYTSTTTAYSNSNSVHEEIYSNNNKTNSGNLIIKKFKSGPQNFNINKNITPIIDNDKIIKNLNKEKFTSNLGDSWSIKNINLYKINSNPNLDSYSSNEFSSLSSSDNQNINNKLYDVNNNINEHYNKYNSINSDYNQLWINPIAENTEILSVNVKLSNEHSATFRLRRFDDLFLTVKLFCEINSIDEKLMKPIIIKSLCALNNIYQVFNSSLDQKSISILKRVNNIYKNICV